MSKNGTTKDLLMRLEKCVRKDPNVYTNTHRQTDKKTNGQASFKKKLNSGEKKVC